MNELQAELLCILEKFLKVCDKLELKYYLANGSALGAEKYGGFIKWDDDIDVAMPREDYERFCLEAKNLLPDNIFIQNFRTDKQFSQFYTKLRDSDTTFIESEVSHLDINHGIYIDIFPLDGYPDKKFRQAILHCKLKVWSWQQFCDFKSEMPIHSLIRNLIFKMFGYHKRVGKTLAKMEKAVKRYDVNTINCCDYGDRQGKGCVPREFYGDGRKAKFEHLEVVIPQRIDDYLKYKYGDWRSELPKEKQKSHHSVTVCDLNKSYREYKK